MQAQVIDQDQHLSIDLRSAYLTFKEIEVATCAFENRFATRIPDRVRQLFARRMYPNAEDLHKRLAAYRVFGDLGYGERPE